MSAPQASCLLYFDDEEAPALRLSQAAGLTALAIERHRFPDGELKLRLPVDDTGRLPPRAVLLRIESTACSAVLCTLAIICSISRVDSWVR